MKSYHVAYGDQRARFTLPASWDVTVARGHAPAQAAVPEPGTWGRCLRAPLESPPLRELAAPGRSVCIVCTDATRACPDEVLVPLLIAELEAGGTAPQDITLLVATGAHRASTAAEKTAKLGAGIAARYRVLDHDAGDAAMLVPLGEAAGVPLWVDRRAVEAGLLLSTGVVEPHQYAGYSGGGKTVAIGCAGLATIEATHGPRFLDDPACRLGRVEGNPFQSVVRAAAERAGLRFVINVVLDPGGRVAAVAAGAAQAVHDALVPVARAVAQVEVRGPFDLAITGVAAPKDANLYQASRAITYLALAADPVVRAGAPIVLAARCPEGAGQGAGERNFRAVLRELATPRAVIDRLRARGCLAGEQRAFMIAQALERHPLYVAGAQDEDVVRDCQMSPAPDVQAAVDALAARLGARARVLIVEDGIHTLPIGE